MTAAESGPPPSSAAPRPFGRTFWPYLIAGFVAAAIFWPSLEHEFVYDDYIYVVDNPQIQSLSRLFEGFWTTFPAHRPEFGTYRPLTHLSLTLDAAAGRPVPDPTRPGSMMPDPRPFHFQNILWHIAATVALLWAGTLALGDRWRWAAFAGAILFAVHPVHAEVVANVTGRSEAMAAFFYLAALGALLKAIDTSTERARWRWLAATLTSFFLALAAKETAITFPLIAAFAVWMRRGAPALRWDQTVEASPEGAANKSAGSRWTRPLSAAGGHLAETAWLLLPVGAMALFYMILRVNAIEVAGVPEETDYYQRVPGLSRSASTAFVFLYYLKLLCISTFYYPDYGFPFHLLGATVEPIRSWASGWAWAGAASAAAVAGVFAWLTARRSAWAWPAGLYLLTVAVYMQVIPFGEIAADRFLYLPSAGFCLLGGMILEWLADKASDGRGRIWALVPLIVLCVAVPRNFAAKTLEQSRLWRNVDIFHEELMMALPDNEEALYSYATVLKNRGVALGRDYLAKKRAGKLQPEEGERLLRQMNAYYARSLELLEKTLRLYSTYDKARIVMADIHIFSFPPRYDKAREQYFYLLNERFQATSHTAGVLYRKIAETYGEEKNWPEAYQMASNAVRHSPLDGSMRQLFAEFALRHGLSSWEAGKPAEALGLLREAKATHPERAEIRDSLAQVYERLNRWPEALAEWRALAQDFPQIPAYRQRVQSIEQGMAKAAQILAQQKEKEASKTP